MQAQVSNGYIRELVAERDYLKQRNIQLSDSLDDNANRYRAILFRLGFDENGDPLPKAESAEQPAPIGEADGANGATPAAEHEQTE